MTGDKLIEKAGSLLQGIPAILCTGCNHDTYRDRPQKAVVSAFLAKPFSVPALLAKIRDLLDMEAGT